MQTPSVSSPGSVGEATQIPKSCLEDSTKLVKTPSREYDLKRVMFDNIEVREYPMILGDNPSVSEGEILIVSFREPFDEI